MTVSGDCAAEIMLRRREMRRDLVLWCKHVLAPMGQQPAAHHLLLLDRLMGMASGELDRVMVAMPPGSAKSTYASVLFPSWWFCPHPGTSVITASHTLELAERFGRKVRNLIAEHALALNYGIDEKNAAAGRWETTNGGEFYACGVGGSVTGRRADLIIVDDPVSSREAAESKLQRDRTWDWYRNDLLTRLKPGGRVILIMTRWHEDDLAGRLLAESDEWCALKLPAICDDADDILGRAIGEPLWPDWQPLRELERIRATLGERDFASLFQQAPRPADGSLFKTGQIEVLDAAPACVATARAWDLASSVGKSADWTSGVKLGRTAEGQFVVLDVVRFRGGPDAVTQSIVFAAGQDGTRCRIGLPKDPGQAGAMQVLYITRQLAGFMVDSSPESGAKDVRAMPVAAQSNVGNLSIVRAPWNSLFLEELYSFPSGKHDDQVDALSRAFAMVGVVPPPAVTRRVHIPWIGR